MDIIINLASAIGGAIAAALATYRVTNARLALPSRQSLPQSAGEGQDGVSRFAPPPTPYVRLTAEDSSRLATVTALLERLVALEEQTQAQIQQLTSHVISLRVEEARR